MIRSLKQKYKINSRLESWRWPRSFSGSKPRCMSGSYLRSRSYSGPEAMCWSKANSRDVSFSGSRS